MAHAEKRPNGKYLARYYDAYGKQRSAGSFATKAAAMDAAEAAESRLNQPEPDESVFATMPLKDYFYEHYLQFPHVQKKTQLVYESCFRMHIEPTLGHRMVGTIRPKDVRNLIKPYLAKNQVYLAHKIKTTLGSVFKALLDEEAVTENPARGVRLPHASPDPFTPLTPDDFKRIVPHLPSPETRFFARFLIGSGCRYGEAVGIQVNDFNPDTREMSIRRRVSMVGKKNSQDGSRFDIREATKNGHKRVIPLSESLAQEFMTFVSEHGLANDDVVFQRDIMFDDDPAPLQVTLGDTWESGNRKFQHGTQYSYVTGKCRCELCRTAINVYRRSYQGAHRKAATRVGNDAIYMRPERWSRAWKDAVLAAGIDWNPRTHDLRHANATIMVAAGVDIFEVQQRLGHRDIATTTIYLHRVDAMKSKAAASTDVFL